MKPSMLIMDDEYGIREFLYELFRQDFDVYLAEDGQQGLEFFEKQEPHLTLIDMRMPHLTGMQVLKEIHARKIATIPIIITADRDIEDVVEAMKFGAYDYLTKPIDFRKLQIIVKNALEKKLLSEKVNYLQKEINHQLIFPDFIGQSELMRAVFSRMENVLNNDATVLITGESGTGKEVVARSIHYRGNRRNKNFVAVDCASIPASLIETELFGYEKGAFTGASKSTAGKFEQADGGTLFLDEIPNISLEAQSKLLRVIQEREFTRVGGNRKIEVDVRIISASNRDLKQLIREGKFREDLYYRLNVIPIELPPLRDRVEDISVLVKHFLKNANTEYDRSVDITAAALRKLMSYSWPGNVRELENWVKRVVLMTEGDVVDVENLPPEILGEQQKELESKEMIGQEYSLAEVEKQHMQLVLERENYNVSKAAVILGVSRKTMYDKIKKYDFRKFQNEKD